MRMPKTCVYAIQAVLYLALREEPEALVPVRRVGEALGIPPAVLVKLLPPLVEEGIVRTGRGPRGGVGLAGAPGDITLLDVIEASGHGDLFESCVLGLDGCGDEQPCPLHREWESVRRRMHATFAMTTIARLRDAVRRGAMRITDAAGGSEGAPSAGSG